MGKPKNQPMIIEHGSEKQQENIGTNAKETDNLEYYREEIEETPFAIIKKENKYWAIMGDHRVTEEKQTREEVIEIIENKEWRFLTTVIAVIVDKILTHKEVEKRING